MTRSIHLVRPGWQGEPRDVEEFAVDSLLHGPHYIRLAVELLQLADQPARAMKIEEILERAYDRETLELTTAEVQEIDALLKDLDIILKRTVVDSHSMIPTERLSELRSRAKFVDLEDRPQHRAVEGISEASSQVYLLREFLKEAIDRGLHVSLD